MAMGLKPTDVYAMSPWEFQACCDGWMKAHTNAVAPPSDAEYEKAFPENETVN
jgi:hypothetical protein